jgi:two-component system CheB/CheR fusion protein
MHTATPPQLEAQPSEDAGAGGPRALFPVVGVGASAGGLAASGELLRELGSAPGVAVVIVHHLDPSHESSLVEIFSRLTPLQVVAATEGVRVEPDHVYVMPPNAGLLIHAGLLNLVPRIEQAGLHLPINRFFESLAQDQDGLAVGVVLSGTGFDGTEGIKAIKRGGGLTLAQDVTAQYPSMPESATATGCVDCVLPPAGIAREIARLAAHAPTLRAKPVSDDKDRDYQQVLRAMRNASGVDFGSYKHSTIRRRLERRLFFHGLTDLPAYLELLKREPAEVEALCEEALIHVTGFFRDPEAFDALRQYVFPKLCEGRARDAGIRIWVPGCSTGEEVYSIAICLLEFLEERQLSFSIKIFGTDLSAAIIEKARSGRYPASIEAEVSVPRLERFFSRDECGYVIRRDVRELCVFAKHDVARDAPFSTMDLVSCRNLMIYLGPGLQDRVLALVHYALNEPGYLLLGSAESVRSFTGFTTVDSKNKLFARSAAGPRLSFDFTKPRRQVEPTTEAPGATDSGLASRPGGQAEVFREADRLVLAEFAPPGVVVTDELVVIQFRGRTAPFLEHAPGAASLDLLRTVREELRLPLRRTIDKARATNSPARESGISLFGEERPRTVMLDVTPFVVHSARLFLVLFAEGSVRQGEAGPVQRTSSQDAERVSEATLQQELASTRQYLESVIEQLEAANEELKAANEEIVSSNEELRSGNEELESAKEELQATNEELRTLNDEMQDRSTEATRLSDDLTNVLSSVEIPIVILGRDGRIRRFTPAASRVFGLAPADLGRSLSEVRQISTIADVLSPIVEEVLAQLRPIDSTIQDRNGQWHQLWVRPYKTLDGRIDGTVIAARDIDAEKRSAEGLVAARKYAEDVVEAIREGIVVLDTEMRVISANQAFLRAFRVGAERISGRRLSELGRSELADAALSRRLDELRNDGSVENVQVELPEAGSGKRSFLLNARRMDGERYLLVLQDVTELESARSAMQRAELSDIMIGAAEGILMADAGARILFANPAAGVIFGYENAELIGLSIDELVPEELRDVHAERRAAYWAAPTPRPMRPGSGLFGRRKDGTRVAIEVTLNTVAREGSQMIVAFVRDVTQQRKVENDVRAYQERLQHMSFDAVVTEERERRRIAMDLHDRLGQALALAQIKLTSVRGELAGEVRSSVDGAVELLEQSITDARGLIFELSPPVLYDLGLKAALGWLAEDLEKRHGIKIEVCDDGTDKPLDDAAKAVIFRAVRELLMNVLKHAQSAEAKVSLRLVEGQFHIDVEDRGVGFELGARADVPARQGFGLLSVREQIARLGGNMVVDSSPGRGTLMGVRIPLLTSAPTDEGGASAAPEGEPS